ncbi:sugar phosphorylase [Treponema sp. TIM-1]|uniref:alpha-amylase family glycosyl hydrolase n=1 Tax=Treponema sp. TIM-1 TaxID=2898417 RepID=UPI00397F37F2
MKEKIQELLVFIYGPSVGEKVYPKVLEILQQGIGKESPGKREVASPRAPFTASDVLLITYGDMLSPPEEGGTGERGLVRLGRFLARWNRGAFTYLHLLPFHPYSSDDGFSVIDYREVDPRFGLWEDIQELGRHFKPVFDFVLNHGSVQSRWFQCFLTGEKEYGGWYITKPADFDYSAVVRPRTHPLLTPFTKKDGSPVHVWTTFSADQVDYDFSNPEVLLEFIRIFMEYYRRGARIVRLDAIAYLWKEPGTSCIHHPKTHAVVRLLRAVIDLLGLDLRILTETNVPHEQNISYFGQGDEAHLVYNFALPPLVLHAALSADAGPLRAWAGNLAVPREGGVFLNFLASHDGVGLTPAQGLVDKAAFAATIEEAKKRGALVSYKSGAEGPIPYELNCSYVEVVAPETLGRDLPKGEAVKLRARAFLATQGVLLALPGLPAIYFHSWIGSLAWQEGPALLGSNRAINREKPPLDRVEKELEDPASLRYHVYRGLSRLLEFRGSEQTLSPEVPHRIPEAAGPVFAVLRGPGPGGRWVLCMQNLGPLPARFTPQDPAIRSLGPLTLEPWETRWIALGGGGERREVSTQ